MNRKAFKAFSELQPEVAARVELADLSDTEWCEARDGKRNLRVTINGPLLPLHSNYSPDRETLQVLEGINLGATDVIYWYGLGLGYAYEALKDWLHAAPNHYLVWIEDDLRVFRRFLEADQALGMVKDPQVVLLYWDYLEEDLEVLAKELASHHLGLRYAITALPSYARGKGQAYEKLQVALRHRSALVNFASVEFLNYGVSFYKSFYHNLLRLPECFRLSGLYGRFPKVPAIICGAGPSLNKNIEILRTLQDRALLFAGGSAINALSAQGIEPHFAGSVDPNVEQFERMSTQSAYEVPFLFKTRVHFQAFDCFQGPKVYIAGNNGYPVTDWVEEKLGVSGPQPREGFNVLHLLMDIARNLGCDPIIFVGMDLAYTGLQLYASDVVEQEQCEERDLTSGADVNFNAFKREDIHGQPVYTLWKWVGESEYTGKYASQHSGVSFVNATEGGLGMPGIPNRTLADVAAQHLGKQRELRNWVYLELEERCGTQFGINEVVSLIRELYLSLKECEQLTEEVAMGFKKLMEALDRDDPAAMKRRSKDIEKAQGALNGEVAYRQVLEPIHQFRALQFEREWREVEHDRRLRTEKDRMRSRLESQCREAAVLRETASVNLILLADSIRRAKAEGLPVPLLQEMEAEMAK